MNNIIKTIIISLNVISFSSSANTSKDVFFNGGFYNLTIPNGFCDITDNEVGDFLKTFLNDNFKKLDESIRIHPKIIYAKCNSDVNFDNLYPWGYIALGKDFGINQKQYNDFVNRNFNSRLIKSLFNKVEDDANPVVNKTLTEYGLSDLGEFKMEFNKPEILWTDKDSSIIYSRLNGNLGEMTIIEDVVYSTTIRKKVTIYAYIYDAAENNPDILKIASILNEAAARNAEKN